MDWNSFWLDADYTQYFIFKASFTQSTHTSGEIPNSLIRSKLIIFIQPSFIF